MIFIFQFFFTKRSKNLFAIKFSHYMPQWHSIFNFFDHKNFFWPIWSTTFGKNDFIFWYSYMATNLKLMIIFIIFCTRVNVCAWLCVNRLQPGFILIVLWYVLLRLLTISANLSLNTFFYAEVIYLYILFFKVPLNLSATTDLSSNHDFIDLL